jgi:hypothetical protein
MEGVLFPSLRRGIILNYERKIKEIQYRNLSKFCMKSTTFLAHVTKSLGGGGSRTSILGSAILALMSFFYVYTVGSYLKVDIYFLQDRITYFNFFHNHVVGGYPDDLVIAIGVIIWLTLFLREESGNLRYLIPSFYGGLIVLSLISRLTDLFDVLILVSLPLVVSLLIYDRFFAGLKFLKPDITKFYANYLAIIGVVIGIISIIIMTLTPFYSSVNSQKSILGIPNYEHSLFALFSSLSPTMLFLLIFCVPIKLLLNAFTIKVAKMKDNISSYLLPDTMRTRTRFIFLAIVLLLSLGIAIIPHIPIINKTNQFVGTDTPHYVDLVNRLEVSHNPQEFMQSVFALTADRPMATIFFFSIVKIVSATPSYTLELMPVILGPALVLVFYFLTRELTSNDTASLLSSFLTAISFQTLIGIYAGFYANWFAIIIGYMSMVFLLRFLKSQSRMNFVVYSTLTLLLLFSHVYTWTIFTIVTSIFLLVLLKLHYYRRQGIIILLLVILSSVIIDVVRSYILKYSGGIEGDLVVSKNSGAGLEQFAQRWSNLVYVTQVYLGSQLSNFIILMLGLYWLFKAKLHKQSTIFLMIFLSLGILPLFFGDITIQGRVFYDIPFQLPAALSLAYIKKQSNGPLLLLPLVLWLVATSVNAESNFYFVSP